MLDTSLTWHVKYRHLALVLSRYGIQRWTHAQHGMQCNYSRLSLCFVLGRHLGFYVIQIYLPSNLIVIISWVSFWLSRDATPARVSLGVTTVLTMTTLMTTLNGTMPKVSYVKSIDVYLITCFLMVFSSLLEFAAVGYMNHISRRKVSEGGTGAFKTPLHFLPDQTYLDVHQLANVSYSVSQAESHAAIKPSKLAGVPCGKDVDQNPNLAGQLSNPNESVLLLEEEQHRKPQRRTTISPNRPTCVAADHEPQQSLGSRIYRMVDSFDSDEYEHSNNNETTPNPVNKHGLLPSSFTPVIDDGFELLNRPLTKLARLMKKGQNRIGNTLNSSISLYSLNDEDGFIHPRPVDALTTSVSANRAELAKWCDRKLRGVPTLASQEISLEGSGGSASVSMAIPVLSPLSLDTPSIDGESTPGSLDLREVDSLLAECTSFQQEHGKVQQNEPSKQKLEPPQPKVPPVEKESTSCSMLPADHRRQSPSRRRLLLSDQQRPGTIVEESEDDCELNEECLPMLQPQPQTNQPLSAQHSPASKKFTAGSRQYFGYNPASKQYYQHPRSKIVRMKTEAELQPVSCRGKWRPSNIDKWSRFLFPFTFISFNLGYWIIYSQFRHTLW